MSLLFFHEPLALLNVPLYEYLGIAQIRVKEVLIFWCCNWHYAKICSTKPKKTEGCYRFAFWLLFDFCSFFSKYLLFVSFCSVLLFCCWCSCIVAWRGVVSVFVCVICFCVWFSLFVVAAFVLCYIYGVFPHGTLWCTHTSSSSSSFWHYSNDAQMINMKFQPLFITLLLAMTSCKSKA